MANTGPKWHKALRVAALLMIWTVAGCGKQAEYRYKLTLTMNTPDGTKEAYTVVNERGLDGEFLGQKLGLRWTKTGDALYLGLGPGKNPLIAMLKTGPRADLVRPKQLDQQHWLSSPYIILARYCKMDNYEQMGGIEIFTKLNECRGRFDVTPDELPELITFDNVNDPKTAVVVDPNNLTPTLGSGVS